MARLTLTNIAAGYSLIGTINANNDLIEAFAELSLQRDGEATNTMTAVLDMNSNTINNLSQASGGTQAVNLNQLNAAISAAATAALAGPLAAASVTVADAGAHLASTDVEGALGELFTGALTYTGGNTYSGTNTFSGVTTFSVQPLFTSASGIQIEDAAGNDDLTISLDGTDITFQATMTGNGQVQFDGITHFQINSSLSVEDRGSAPGDTGGYGQLWSESTSPNRPVWTDSNGVDSALAQIAIAQTIAGIWTFSASPLFDSGSLFVKEQASAEAYVAAYGQLWVQTNTPNLLMFTDDTGVDFEVAGIGAGGFGETSSTAALAAIGNVVNTQVKKVEGYMVFNITTNKLCIAVGNADGDVWVGADGVTLHTPVV